MKEQSAAVFQKIIKGNLPVITGVHVKPSNYTRYNILELSIKYHLIALECIK